MKLHQLLIIPIFIIFTACGSGNNNQNKSIMKTESIDLATINFKRNLEYSEKVSLVYPENWNKKYIYDSPEILVAFAEPLENENDKFLENILLLKVDNINDLSPDNINGIKIIASRKTTVASFEAQEDIFDADIPGAEEYDMRFMQIAFNFNGAFYALFYTAEKKSFERNIEIVRHMAKSMELGQIIFDGFNLNSDLKQPGKPAIASDGEDFLVVSCRTREYSGNIYDTYDLIGKIIKGDRSMGKEFIIHTNNDYTNRKCALVNYNVIFDGENYLVTYSGHLADNLYRNKILGNRVSTSGELLDILSLNISQNKNISAYEPVIAFDGNKSLVVWSESDAQGVSGKVVQHNILGAFIETNGTVSNNFIIQNNVEEFYSGSNNIYRYTPQVTYGKDQYMVIWSPYFFSDTRRESIPIYGQQIDLDGNLLLSEPLMIRSDSGNNPRYAQIASDGKDYLVAWVEGLLETNVIRSGRFTVYGRHISSIGELINGGEDDLGTIIASHIMTKDTSWGAKEVPKEFLHLSYYNNRYTFLWTSVNPDPEQAVYAVQATKDLKNISQPLVIAGAGKDADNRIPKPSQANIISTKQQSFVIWPSRNGVIEGWFINDSYFIYNLKSLE